MPLAVRHRRAVYQLGRPVPFVHQKSNFTLEQLDPEVIGVRRLPGVVEQQAALRAGLQLEFPSTKQRREGEDRSNRAKLKGGSRSLGNGGYRSPTSPRAAATRRRTAFTERAFALDVRGVEPRY